MKTTETFEFNDNEENRKYKIDNAESLYSVISDLDNELAYFTKQKADDQDLDIDTIDTVRSILHVFMNKHCVKLL